MSSVVFWISGLATAACSTVRLPEMTAHGEEGCSQSASSGRVGQTISAEQTGLTRLQHVSCRDTCVSSVRARWLATPTGTSLAQQELLRQRILRRSQPLTLAISAQPGLPTKRTHAGTGPIWQASAGWR